MAEEAHPMTEKLKGAGVGDTEREAADRLAEAVEKAAHRSIDAYPCWCVSYHLWSHDARCRMIKSALAAYRAARSKGGNDGR